MSVATLSPAVQRQNAIQKANRVRLFRADVKRLLKEGVVTIPIVVEAQHPDLAKAPVIDFLTAQHRWGLRRSQRALSHCNLTERTQLGSMTNRQRQRLLDYFS